MNVKPFGKRIYIKPEEEKTLIQTDSSKNTVRGIVVATGPLCSVAKPGDTLLFTSWGVDEVQINGEKHYFLLETDEFILAILETEQMPSGLAASVSDISTSGKIFSGDLPGLSQEEVL